MAFSSPFAAWSFGHGARMRSYGGIDLAESFTDAQTEAIETRLGAGLFDRSWRASLRFIGQDRATFLHNLLSNDVAALRPGTGCYATLLTRESKVVADGDVLCLEDAIRFELDRSVTEKARAHLERFLVADDVEIDDRSEQDASLGVHGPRAPEIVKAAFPDCDLPQRELEHRLAAMAGATLLIVRTDWTGDPGFDFVTARADALRVWQTMVSIGEARGLLPAGMAAAEILRLEAGRPRIGVDFDETRLVLEAALERGVHFSKGCYLGQEIVERASARGHVNKRLVGLRIEGETPPLPDARIIAEESEVGRVTSGVFSPHVDSAIALGYVRRGFTDPGTRVSVEIAATRAPAVVATLPFYRRC